MPGAQDCIHVPIWKGEGIMTQGTSENCKLYQTEGPRMKPTAGEHETFQHRNTFDNYCKH